jgi:hypothetical protein
MSQQYPIKLYVTSRKHNPDQIKQIEETEYKITRSDQQSPSITYQNALRFVSWMFGWNLIDIKDYPKISRSDVLGQIKDFIENNTTSIIAGEEADNTMGNFVKEILSTFTSTVDSLSNTLLNVDEMPNIRLPVEMPMPPISVFELIKRTIGCSDPIQMCIPRTSEDMLRRELEYFVHNNNQFKAYTHHLTGPYLVMYKMLNDNPNTPIEHVFNEAMKRAHENTFQSHTQHMGIAMLKAEIADYINSLEIAVQVPHGNERDQHFEIMRTQLLRNMYDVYQLFLIFKNFDAFKKIENVSNLHLALNDILSEAGNLLVAVLSNPAIASREYEQHVTRPMHTVLHNLQELHVQLCLYLRFQKSKFGYAYGMVDVISAQLFQIMLLMMAGVDQNTTTKLCIHVFGSVIVDLFFQRIMTHIWDRDPPIDSTYTNYVISKYRPIQAKYKINQLSQLSLDPRANQFQDDLKQLIETEKFDNTFFDFLLTFNFSFTDRHAYNMQAFARKIKSEKNININPQTFGMDLLSNLNSAILNSQCALYKIDDERQTKSIYLYDRSIISAVFFSSGVQEFAKSFNGGEIYKNALTALLSDNQHGNK